MKCEEEKNHERCIDFWAASPALLDRRDKFKILPAHKF